MSSSEDNKNKQVNIDTITPNECLDFLWKALNKASNKGVFNIDESYSIRVIFNKLAKTIDNNVKSV